MRFLRKTLKINNRKFGYLKATQLKLSEPTEKPLKLLLQALLINDFELTKIFLLCSLYFNLRESLQFFFNNYVAMIIRKVL